MEISRAHVESTRWKELDRAYVMRLLVYDPESGVIKWRRRAKSQFPNDKAWRAWNANYPNRGRAGGNQRSGPWKITIDRVPYRALDLAVLITDGPTPDGMVVYPKNGSYDDASAVNIGIGTIQEARKSTVLHHPYGLYSLPLVKKWCVRAKVRQDGGRWYRVYHGPYDRAEDAYKIVNSMMDSPDIEVRGV